MPRVGDYDIVIEDWIIEQTMEILLLCQGDPLRVLAFVKSIDDYFTVEYIYLMMITLLAVLLTGSSDPFLSKTPDLYEQLFLKIISTRGKFSEEDKPFAKELQEMLLKMAEVEGLEQKMPGENGDGNARYCINEIVSCFERRIQ